MLAKVTAEAKKGDFNAQAITSPTGGVMQSLQAMPGPEGPGRGRPVRRSRSSTRSGSGCRSTSATWRSWHRPRRGDPRCGRRPRRPFAPGQAGSSSPLGRPPGGDGQRLLRGREQGRPAPDRPARRSDPAPGGGRREPDGPPRGPGPRHPRQHLGLREDRRPCLLPPPRSWSIASSATWPSSPAATSKPGDKVVTAGAAELFGAEFGGFK